MKNNVYAWLVINTVTIKYCTAEAGMFAGVNRIIVEKKYIIMMRP